MRLLTVSSWGAAAIGASRAATIALGSSRSESAAIGAAGVLDAVDSPDSIFFPNFNVSDFKAYARPNGKVDNTDVTYGSAT
jgi:hypothetical protein